MKRNSIFAFLCCKIKHEMYILKFPNECPLTRPGTILVFGKEYILFSLFNSLLFFFLSNCFNYRFLWLHNYSWSVANTIPHRVWPFWTYNSLSALDKPINISTMLVGFRDSQRGEVLFWVCILGDTSVKIKGHFCENLTTHFGVIVSIFPISRLSSERHSKSE